MNYEKILTVVKHKIDRLMEKIDPTQRFCISQSSENGGYTANLIPMNEVGQWTHSFFNGIVAYLYLHYQEEKYLTYLLAQEKKYFDYLYNNEKEISHDVGFLYSLYAVALYKITGKASFQKLALKAADELGKRYQFRANVVQSFFDMRIRGITDEIAMIIVDDMMNMQLLMWAYKETGHSFYRSIYENHIENSIKYLIREDYSVRHAYHFDAKRGTALSEMNYCGNSIGSHWARGTSWMIYGLSSAWEFTGKESHYRQPLIGITEKYLSCLEKSVIPVWDFRLKKEQKSRLDSSAAAISASAFLRMQQLNLPMNLKKESKMVAECVLKELCTAYFASEEKENLITHGQCGDLETGVIWGDYFFVELLMRQMYGQELMDFWL